MPQIRLIPSGVGACLHVVYRPHKLTCPRIRLPAGVRLGQLSLTRGESSRHKILLVEGLDPGGCV
jgi:hypothetical protein